MSDQHANYELARAYFTAVSNGELPDSLLTPDMTAWLTSGGTLDKTRYQHLIKLLAAMCDCRTLQLTHLAREIDAVDGGGAKQDVDESVGVGHLPGGPRCHEPLKHALDVGLNFGRLHRAAA